MNLLKNKKIAIVGGGPGGLTIARLLQMNGADVKVYERDAHKHARMQGATLDLHEESGLKALKEAGLMDAFWENYRPGADRLRIVDKNADIIYDDVNEKQNEPVYADILGFGLFSTSRYRSWDCDRCAPIGEAEQGLLL